MKIIIFEILVLIKYLLVIISILGVLVLNGVSDKIKYRI